MNFIAWHVENRDVGGHLPLYERSSIGLELVKLEKYHATIV